MNRRGFIARLGAVLAAPALKLAPARAAVGDGVALRAISHPIGPPVPDWIEVGGPFEYVLPPDMVAKIGGPRIIDAAIATMQRRHFARCDAHGRVAEVQEVDGVRLCAACAARRFDTVAPVLVDQPPMTDQDRIAERYPTPR